jgi:hypothetical protein
MPRITNASARTIAAETLATAQRLGWTITQARDSIVTISKTITPNNAESFRIADSEYYTILSQLPRTQPGSMWGTDGGGIGGLSAMISGRFVMNTSGVSKLVVRAIADMIG